MTTLNNTEITNEAPKHLIDLLGSTLIGTKNIKILDDLDEPVIGKKYIVTGINGNKEKQSVNDYKLFIEESDGEHFIELYEKDVEEYFKKV